MGVERREVVGAGRVGRYQSGRGVQRSRTVEGSATTETCLAMTQVRTEAEVGEQTMSLVSARDNCLNPMLSHPESRRVHPIRATSFLHSSDSGIDTYHRNLSSVRISAPKPCDDLPVGLTIGWCERERGLLAVPCAVRFVVDSD